MTSKIYKCFIASPSDTQTERDICDNVFSEINKSIGQHFNFRLEALKWETNTFPSFGQDGQDVINTQIGSDYDIFIGIMWKKFGTKTPRAESGTEEEFNIAYKKWFEMKSNNIMIYFNNAAINIDEIEEEEITKVKNFKKTVSELGGLYCKYDGIEDFKKKLKVHLEDYLLSLEKKTNTQIENISTATSKVENEFVLKVLNKRLSTALHTFTSQPIIWVDPIISKSDEILQNPDENSDCCVSLTEILDNPRSIIIQAPPQFGLTCLAYYFSKEAWEKNSSFWLYLDSNNIKSHSVDKAIKKELDNFNISIEDVKCIIIDSWTNYEKESFRLLKNISVSNKDIPIIVMQTIDDSKFQKETNNEIIERKFELLHLLALSRSSIRKVVSAYNNDRHIGDEDTILAKVILDLEVLNIHRTPFNCLTLLKVSEKYFDESPVNRTKMLEMVLFLLFNVDIPTYKTKPDLKDCEYVLGCFCEKILKTNVYSFSREIFIKELNSFCKDKLIDLEVELVFEILFLNNIIIKRDSEFMFRFSYWIFYFAAHRMHRSPEFALYIFEEAKYISYPEIIEFYTGIDRNRSDALIVLINDLRNTCDIVSSKVALPEDLDPFKFAQWRPTIENITKIQNELNDDVQSSKLPNEVKDRYADRCYDQTRPYNQSVNTILQEYSVVVLMQKIKASSVALRNSDYVSPELKKEMLNEIMRSWSQLSNVLFVLSPVLASQGYASFEGVGFILTGDFGSTFDEKLNHIIQVNPTNIVGLFKDYLYSGKMGPLLFDHFSNEKNELKRHKLALLFIFEKPRGWKKQIEDYIGSISKNSFYLFDIFNTLKAQYRFGFVSTSELNEMKYLIKMVFAKHELGTRKPGYDAIKRISDKIIPNRDSLIDTY